MTSTVNIQTATYSRAIHNYYIGTSYYTGYDRPAVAAKNFAQALVSLGMTISYVETDTTAEYDELRNPSSQSAQAYKAHVIDPEFNVGIYVYSTTNSNVISGYGSYVWLRTGLVVDGRVQENASTVAYCFDATTLTITKESFGSFVKYIFPLSNSSVNGSSAGSSTNNGVSTVVGHFATISSFKATNLFTDAIETFGTFGVKSGNYWFIGTVYNTSSLAAQQAVGHTDVTPQPAGKAVLWQSPLYCGGHLYDKINGGRLFRCDANISALPVGSDFTIDGVTLRALSTSYALELT